MSYGLYSERFLTVAAAGVDVSYAVPLGKRAVVRCLVLVNTSATPILCICGIGVAYLFHGTLPAATTTVLGELRVPVYGGESIVGYVGSAGATITAAGYLFTDASRARAPDVERALHDQGVPLPAAA